MLKPADQIVDIVVEIELAGFQRHVARIAPVGDPYVVARQHPLDRAAQQGRIMARHRRDDQQLRRILAGIVLEMLQLPERFARLDRFGHADRLTVDLGLVQLETGLATRRRSVGKDLQRRSEHRAAAEIAERVGGVLHDLCTGGRERACPGEPALLHVESVIKHVSKILASGMDALTAPLLVGMLSHRCHCATHHFVPLQGA